VLATALRTEHLAWTLGWRWSNDVAQNVRLRTLLRTLQRLQGTEYRALWSSDRTQPARSESRMLRDSSSNSRLDNYSVFSPE
jgi:hypothetical protein